MYFKEANILIVDIDCDNVAYLQEILEIENYRIDISHNETQAIRITKKKLPDLILFNIPVSDTEPSSSHIILQKISKANNIPVIYLINKDITKIIMKGYEEWGLIDYVSKPVTPVEILARIRLHLELKTSREQIATIANERQELLELLCHDLNTPLVAMHALLELINQDWNAFSQNRKIYLSEANMAVESALEIIDLVKKMRKSEEQKTEKSTVMLKEAIDVSLIFLKARIKRKHITVDLTIEKNIFVLMNRGMLINSIFNNILTNAIKFSYHNSTIFINAIVGKKFITVIIRDQGIGITDEMQQKLFQLEGKPSRLGTDNEEGSGFGLSLVEKFITLNGGSIKVSSKSEQEYPKGHGTEVKLKLPRSL